MAALRAVADEEALWGWEGRGEGYKAALAVALHCCCCWFWLGAGCVLSWFMCRFYRGVESMLHVGV